MKKIIIISLACLNQLCLVNSNAQGQNTDFVTPTISVFTSEEDTMSYSDGRLASISATYAEGAIYVNIKTIKDKTPGFFILERSFDGITFEGVDVREVIPVVIDAPILYSLSDKSAPDIDAYYRVKKIAITLEDGAVISYLNNYLFNSGIYGMTAEADK
ncbi:MAG: hypothetical protein KKA07_17050 [Bacteroidetes bacterium]|nr:hypothetical protein [Bacteroidota bacterium]MBU1720776.1 hypothetical protein [Bacteroidota bacterium]